MKLKARILNKHMQEILDGKRKEDLRQFDAIIFIDEDGKEYKYDIEAINLLCFHRQTTKKSCDGVEWADKPIYRIQLGKRISK